MMNLIWSMNLEKKNSFKAEDFSRIIGGISVAKPASKCFCYTQYNECAFFKKKKKKTG